MDMLFDRMNQKWVLFQIHPKTGFLLDIMHFDGNKVGEWIVDDLSPVFESPAEFVKKRRDEREIKEFKDQEEYSDKINRMVDEDWDIWEDFFEEMNSKGNVHKRGNEKKPWYDFLLPTIHNYMPKLQVEHMHKNKRSN